MSQEPEPELLVPQSPEAEKAVITSLFFGNKDSVFAALADRRLSAQTAFMNPGYREIFTIIQKLHSEQRAVDLVTVQQEVVDRRKVEECGGPFGVADMATFHALPHNAEHYAEILLQKHRLRSCIQLCDRTRARAFFNQDEAPQILIQAAEELAEIAQIRIRSKSRSLTQLMSDKLSEMSKEGRDESIIKTGLSKLDRESPVRRGDMPLILAGEKVGKSMVAMSIAGNMAKAGLPVIYFSLEMTAKQQFDRFFHGWTRIPMAKDRVSDLVEHEIRSVERMGPELNTVRCELRDDLHDLPSILCAAREQKRLWPDLAAIFVDYAQLVCVARQKGDNREREIGIISRSLRALSLELNAAVFALSQVNKQDESRESKTLEQDATAIWLLTLTDEPRKRMLAIPRQRNGDSGIAFPVSFLGHIARVEDYAIEKP